MGGCVVSCMSAVNSTKQVENKHIQAVQAMKAVSVQIGTESSPTESRIYRAPSMADLSDAEMKAQFYGGEYGTLMHAMENAVAKHSARRAMAYRPWDHIEKTEIEDGGKKKPWELIHLKETQYITYKDMWERMMAFGNGLAKLGLQAGGFLGIYEETRWEWIVTLYGAWSQGLTGVTVYSNLGEDALRYAIKESDLPAMVLNGKEREGLDQKLQSHRCARSQAHLR